MGEPERIVVVEDDEQVAVLIETVLRTRRGDGVTVVRYDRVEGTAAAILADLADLVLVDLRLPDGSGLDVLAGLREVHDSTRLPVLVLTGSSEPEALEQAFLAGASDFVRKPCSIAELHHRVDVHLRAARLQRQADADGARRAAQVAGLDRVLEAVDVAVWVDDRDGATLYGNQRARGPDGVGMRDRIAERTDLRRLPAPGPAQQFRVVWDTEDGQLQAVDVVRQRVEVDGTEVSVIAAHDATERAVATRALERALEATDRAHSVRTRFLTAVSHELRTPLTVIRGAFETARRRSDDPLLRAVLDAGVRQSVRLQDLVLDLLLVAQDDAEVLDRRSVRVPSLVADALARCSEAERVDVHLVDGTLDADRDRLSRALATVIDNALRFSPAGSRCLCSVDVDDDVVSFAVEDAGPGIDADFRDEVFEPFARGNADVEHSPGTGIGLTVARILVRAHGGRILIGTSPRLGGAMVRVVVPVRRGAGDLDARGALEDVDDLTVDLTDERAPAAGAEASREA